MTPLYKTTVVIWSEYNPHVAGMELEDLARAATSGDAFCSKQKTAYRLHPTHDKDWVATEFFDDPEEVQS